MVAFATNPKAAANAPMIGKFSQTKGHKEQVSHRGLFFSYVTFNDKPILMKPSL
jgi:hypothetical protein